MASVRTSRPVPPGNSVADEHLEVLVHVGEGLGEDPHDLVVDGPDDLVQLSAGPAHVLDLLLEETVTLLERAELLQGQGVHRAERRQLRLHGRGPLGRRHAFGQRGARRPHGLLGLAPELAAQRLDGGLLTDPGLGQLEGQALERVAGLGQTAARPPTAPGAASSRRAPPARTSRAAATRCSLQPLAQTGQPAGMTSTTTPRRSSGPGVGLQPAAALTAAWSRSATCPARRRSTS